MEFERQSGIFLHPTSLPGDYGIGSFGEEAYQFIDFLAEADQSLWQICPLGPTGYGDSPYQSLSSFAGNPMLISLEKLVKAGLLKQKDLKADIYFDKDKVEYGKVINFKTSLLKKAFTNFSSSGKTEEFESFCAENRDWLEDYALFRAIKEYFDEQPWQNWDDDIKFREEKALQKYREKLATEIEFQRFMQYIFFKQWAEVKDYANAKGVKIVGDLPIFVALDSADTWANPELFLFDEKLKPTKVAGVPPDYFSETGQLWGNPLYDWDKLKENNYQWWIERVKSICNLVDIVRLDHFRGFAAYWAIPYGEENAVNGQWEDGPGAELFEKLEEEIEELPIIAEDLGVITDRVTNLKERFNFPGMQIVQFAFDSLEKDNVVPEKYTTENLVAYTGTHDNNTSVGWYKEDASEQDKEKFNNYLENNLEYTHDSISWNFMEIAWSSKANIALAPLQDVFSLSSQARFNTPGTLGGNWEWKFRPELLTEARKKALKEMTERHNR